MTEPYHPLNVGWNGCSKIATGNSTLIYSYDTPLPSNSTLAIIGPSLPFSPAESKTIREYLENNGTVLLADDRGSGNSLLQALNVSASFDGRTVADVYAYEKNPSFPLLSNFSPSPFAHNVSLVILNHPSFLDIRDEKRVSVLASTSPFAFIDIQGTGEPAQNESVDSYPIVAYTRFGLGTLILISDASAFINDLIELHSNLQLFKNIVRANGGALLFDVAHIANAPITNTHVLAKNALDGFVRFAGGNLYFQAAVVILVLAVTMLFGPRRRSRAKKGDSHVLYSPRRLNPHHLKK